jgi:glutaredoxin 3
VSVIVYSTPSCSFCSMAKDFLRKKQVPFEEYDVSRDRRKADEMVRKSGQMGVPVLDVNGRILVGFRPAEIESALKR